MPSLARYGIIIVFPTFYLFSAALKKYSIRWQRFVWICIILFQLCNIYGGFLPVPPRIQIHEGSFLERSKEFTLMREEDQKFCRLLEENFSETPLVVPWPFLHMLTVPEFGYVQKPLKEVYAGEYFHHLKNVKKMTKETLKKNPVFLYAPDCFNWKIPQQAEFVFVSNREDPTAGYILYRLRFNFSNNNSMR